MYGQKRAEEFFKLGIMFDAERFSRVVLEELERFRSGGSIEAIDDLTTLVIDFIDKENTHIYNFNYPSKLEVLGEFYREIEEIFNKHHIDPQVSNPFIVAVSEAVTNAIIHGHKRDDSKNVQITIELNKSRLIADIVDEGNCQNISKMKAQDLVFDPSAESGRGLGLIRRLTDAVDFRKTPHGGLGIRISKYLIK